MYIFFMALAHVWHVFHPLHIVPFTHMGIFLLPSGRHFSPPPVDRGESPIPIPPSMISPPPHSEHPRLWGTLKI